MHLLSIHFGPNQLVWALLFKEKDKAEAAEKIVLEMMRVQTLAQQVASDKVITVEDDFGQRAHLASGSVWGVLCEDTNYSQEGAIQRWLHGEHTKVKATLRAQSDSALKVSRMQMPSFDPMANGRFQS